MDENHNPKRHGGDEDKKLKEKIRFGKSVRKHVPYKPICLPKWNRSYEESEPPKNLTVVNISQDYKLQHLGSIEVADTCKLCSSEYLKEHGLDASKLQIEDFFQKGIRISTQDGRLESSQYIADDIEYLKFREDEIDGFKSALSRLIFTLKDRIKWLTSGSREIFGVIKGERPCILIDLSNQNCSYGRLETLKEHLKLLVDEQLMKKSKVLIGSVGNQLETIWNEPMLVTGTSNLEITKWISCLQPSGGFNLLNALKKVLKMKDVDSVTMVVGNSPNQKFGMITDYLLEALSGRQIDILNVAYDNKFPGCKVFLEELSKQLNGRYHDFNVNTYDEIKVQSTDLNILQNEVKRATQVLKQVDDLKDGLAVNNKMIVYDKKVSTRELLAVKDSVSLVDEFGAEHLSLSIKPPSPIAETSSEWLKTHGLKAKGLTLYQVMAPNAYSYVGGYVSVLNKSVDAKNYERHMSQMEWKDGSIKNVHIDPVLLYDYQRHLKIALGVYHKRLEWLNSHSQKSFGIIREENIVILVDLSLDTFETLAELQLEIKQLLEQQLTNKNLFNMICFGETVRSYSPSMVKSLPGSLTACWRWFLQQQCNGKRKFLPAIKHALENETEIKHNIEIHGVYLIATGISDESQDIVSSYIEEVYVGTNKTFNCIFFQPSTRKETYEINEAVNYVKSISRNCSGRFHWVNSEVAVENDDVKLLNEEMSKANNFLQKSQLLLDKIFDKRKENIEEQKVVEYKPRQRPSSCKEFSYPRQTQLSQARIGLARPKSATRSISPSKKSKKPDKKKYISWKPSSVHSGDLIPPVPAPIPGKTFKDVSERHVKHHDPLAQTFYTEVGNSVGVILNPNSGKRHCRPLSANTIKIPNYEENMSTKSWLNKYGICKLKLDFNRIVSNCEHFGGVEVPTIGKSVHARYCDIFPSINIDGVLRHLHLNSKELAKYEESVEILMKRYLKRLKWLLQGSRRLFGTLIEDKVVILIDTSGSMSTELNVLKDNLIALIWEQIYKGKKWFNLIGFSDDVTSFKKQLVEATQENCQHAVQWIDNLNCHGETATLDALKAAFHFDTDKLGFYLLTDGKPDSSTSMVLRETARMNVNRNIKIHTISFNCNDSTANTFLQMLALQSKGRYHQYQTEDLSPQLQEKILIDGTILKEKNSSWLQNSDDVRVLVKEIETTRKFLNQAKSFRSCFDGARKSGKTTNTKEHHQQALVSKSNQYDEN